jgi:uncharacterized membrane protein YbaN (DUF454 family)
MSKIFIVSLASAMAMQQETGLVKEPSERPKVVRAICFVAGTVSLAFGAVGVVLPVLPTTPLLLLAVACYCRSSERMTRWVLTNRYFGNYIRRYREGKGIPLNTKVFALAALWIMISYSAFFVVNRWWIVQVVLFVIATVVSVHIVKLPTYLENKP